MALVRGEIESGSEPVLVRMHSHCVIPPPHRGSMQAHRTRRPGTADLSASDVEGIFRRTHRESEIF